HVGAENVDMAVVVDVSHCDAHGPEIGGLVCEGMAGKSAVAVVNQKYAIAELIGDEQVGPTVIVNVQPGGCECGALAAARPADPGHVLELPTATVAEQDVAPRVVTTAG